MATKTIVRYRRMPRSRHRSRGKLNIPIAVIAGLGPTLAFAIDGWRLNGGQGPDGGPQEALHRLCMYLTGYEWKGKYWSAELLARGWVPLAAGFIVHKMANRFGVNRAIAKAGIPLFRI